MKLIRNTTHEPIRVPLAGDKVLHLGPGKTGQVAADSMERAAFRKLVEAGAIEIVGEGAAEAAATGAPAQPREATHGHHPPTVVLPKGNR
jgi:hypothetical protein